MKLYILIGLFFVPLVLGQGGTDEVAPVDPDGDGDNGDNGDGDEGSAIRKYCY